MFWTQNYRLSLHRMTSTDPYNAEFIKAEIHLFLPALCVCASTVLAGLRERVLGPSHYLSPSNELSQSQFLHLFSGSYRALSSLSVLEEGVSLKTSQLTALTGFLRVPYCMEYLLKLTLLGSGREFPIQRVCIRTPGHACLS